MKREYKIPSLSAPPLFVEITLFILITTISYFIFVSLKVNYPLTSLTLASLWILSLLAIIFQLRARKRFLKIDDKGFHFFWGEIKKEIDWSEIEKVGFRGINIKKFGLTEIVPYLMIKLKNPGLLDEIKISSRQRFFLKKEDLLRFNQTEELGDCYFSMEFASEEDSELIEFLSQKTTVEKESKPLLFFSTHSSAEN